MDYDELIYICGSLVDQYNYISSKVNIKIVLGAAIILGAIIYINLNSILQDFKYVFNEYNIKYVLIAITTVGALVYSKFITTNDLPMCPHNEISSPRRPLNIREYGCHGHRPDSINLSELKTGDIIMISYGGLRSLFSSIFYNSVWVHTGIVWVDSNKTNEIYIFEAANYFPPYIGEVVRIPILKWMKINRNVKAIAIIPINQKISDESFECAAKKYENTKIVVESLRPSWFRFLKTKRICDLPEDHLFSNNNNELVKKNNNSVFYITCQELTIGALQEAGVIEKDITPCSFLPSTVYNRKFNCINGFSYGEPKQISFHEHVGEITNSIEY